jgi:hypothetical protein
VNCGTCRHWRRYESGDFPSDRDRFGECGLIGNRPLWEDAYEFVRSGDKVVGYRILDAQKDSRAFTQDGSGYTADLITRDDYGCVEYEEAE